MWTRMAVWTIAAGLVGGAAASAWNGDEAALFTVLAHVTDYAKVSRKQLAAAQERTTAAYRAIGLDVIWSLGLWSPETGPSTDVPAIDVRIIMLSKEMAQNKIRSELLDDSALGITISGAKEASQPHRVYRPQRPPDSPAPRLRC
jgi:hypothetical protein